MRERGLFNPEAVWRRPRFQAYLWHCGDDECDCYHPVVDLVEPSQKAGYPWIKRTEIWRGSHFSRPDSAELEQMKVELEAKALEMGIVLDEDHWGEVFK